MTNKIGPLLIIIEGPDCTGKSTLSRRIAHELGNTMLFHATAKGQLPVAMQDYQLNILDNAQTALEEFKQSVILDRHWPSEKVYGEVFRKGNPHAFDQMPLIETIAKMRGIYIMCDREDVIEAHRAEQDDDHPYDDTNFQLVVEKYRTLTNQMEMLGLPVLRYNIHTWGKQFRDFMDLILVKHSYLHDSSH